MKTKKLLTALAAALVCISASHGQSILLGGFDGNQTQTAIAPATATSSSGVRQLTVPLQGAGVSGAVSARIWTDQATNKELQWNTTGAATDGLWGSSAFTPASSTSTSKWVATQAAASWINYEITNTGTNDVVLDKFHINAKRLTTTAAPTGSPDTLTISLEQNRTFANPPVLIRQRSDGHWHENDHSHHTPEQYLLRLRVRAFRDVVRPDSRPN